MTDDGGAPARRAVVRWAWRLFRRQWQGQFLLLALLTLAVAAAVGGAAAAYNLAPAEGNAEFGSARHSIEFSPPDSQRLAADVAAAGDWFGTIDVIGRRFLTVPGMFEPVEFRAQNPNGPFTSPMLALVEGRYPVSAGEVALTDGVADLFDASLGATLDGGTETFTVVGLVENPSNLNDEFALVEAFRVGAPESVTILVGGSDDQLLAFRPPSKTSVSAVARTGNEDVLAAVVVLIVASVVLLLVALVAAAGFVVIAQRRLRQLGMLAAIGATEKHLRLVMVANGAVVGAIAAIVGTCLALLGWVLAVPSLEAAVGHRIDRFDVPWWLIVTSMTLAVVTATAAAWWPARAVARIPIVTALSGRPTRPQPARRSAAIAGPLLIAGTGFLVIAGNPLYGWNNLLLIITGILALILGVVLVGPLTIGALSGFAERASIAVRLAIRDLARYQARSAAALAAISLALGMAAAIVIATSAAIYATAAEGNLADTQLLVRIGEIPAQGDVAPIPDRTMAEVAQLGAVVDDMAAGLGRATVIPIDVAVAPDFEGFGGLPAVVLTEEIEPGLNRILTFLYVASPEILEHYNVELEMVRPETEILTVESGELWLEPMRPELVENPQQLTPVYTSLPASFITPEALHERAWVSAPAAWLIETAAPITETQFDQARDLAASAGITVEARSDQANLIALRTGATGVGVLVAFGILAMTVGLIRSEADRDVRTLTATGATSTIRRTLTGTTAGFLALLGAVLGTAGAYAGFAASYANNFAALLPIPSIHLLVLVIGLPLVAGGGGWVLAGRDPGALGRPPID